MEDTIVAISSAAGSAARSIVRLSGPRAGSLAAEVFTGPVVEAGGFRVLDGAVCVECPWPVTAPARAYVFRAPRSYTRQDVVELHVPGPAVASVVREAAVAAGARPAEPGEFTARAFLSGRLDLARAEAVADIIDAEADAQLRSAVGVLEGSLARLCRPVSQTLTEALATVESSIDFADEDIELCAPGELFRRIADAGRGLEAALRSAGRWTGGDATPKIAIAGLANAGKSSLLNALSGVDRAIVSAMAGTTRDVLSAPARLADGVEVLLLDAAGLTAGADPLSTAAHAAAREAIRSAEAVLFVVDAADPDAARAEALLSEVRRLNRRARPLIVANKMDLVDEPPLPQEKNADPPLPRGAISDSPSARGEENSPRRKAGVVEELDKRFGGVLGVSAARGDGLGALRKRLAEDLVEASAPPSDGLMLHDRQRRAMSESVAAADRAAGLLAAAAGVANVAELAAIELRAALAGLKELTGEVVTEDILSAIFSRFCVGK